MAAATVADVEKANEQSNVGLSSSSQKVYEITQMQKECGKQWPTLLARFSLGKPSSSPLEAMRLILETSDYMLARLDPLKGTKKPVLVVVGITGAGKSVACNWLSGGVVRREVVLDEDGDEDGAKVVVDKPAFLVGNDNLVSMTFSPTVLQLEDFILIDFPGFCDTGGPEIRLGMDIAFRKMTQMFAPLHLLALLPIESFKVGKGAAAKAQLSKLSRLLPPPGSPIGGNHIVADADSGCIWKIGVTKCDKKFMKGAKGAYADALKTVEEFNMLLAPHVLNINEHIFAETGNKQFMNLLFETKTPTAPPEGMVSDLKDVFGCVPSGVMGDCLDPQDLEWLFQRLKHTEFFKACFHAPDPSALQASLLTLEVNGQAQKPDWEASWKALTGHLDVLDKHCKEVITDCEDLLKHARLSIQGRNTDVQQLCEIPQCRLKLCFVKIESQYMSQSIFEVVHLKEAVWSAAQELNKQGFFREADFATVTKFHEACEKELVEIVQDMGYTDVATFLGAVAAVGVVGGVITTGVGAFVVAGAMGEALGLGAALGVTAATGGLVILGAAVIGGIAGLVHYAKNEGNKRSRELVKAFEQSFNLLIQAAKSCKKYKQRLTRLQESLEKLQVLG